MNVSGGPVAKAARAYGLPAEAVVVVHDDLESAFGRVRPKQGGGLAGHNGLRSIAERLGTRDFLRIRLGVGRPRRGDPRDIADWLLAPFEDDEDPEPMITAGGGLRRADCPRGDRGCAGGLCLMVPGTAFGGWLAPEEYGACHPAREAAGCLASV